MHTDYSSLGPPQRLKAYPPPHTLQGAAVAAAAPPLNLRAVPAAEADRPLNGKKAPPSSSSSGFLRMDSSLSTILFNAEASQARERKTPGRLPRRKDSLQPDPSEPLR